MNNPSGSPTGGNRSVSYVYDPVGNRTSVTEGSSSTVYVPNNLNQYTSVGAESLPYDGNGNLAGRAGWTYTYDAQNRLVDASSAAAAYQFVYDGRNRSIRRTVSSWNGHSLAGGLLGKHGDQPVL
ncbi:MAG: hypothetical protein ACR2ID_09510 [Chthoniobacterales bacterium]